MPITDNHAKGFFMMSRSILESDIWDKPAEYVKVWIFLIARANHAPAKYRGFEVLRGQFFGTYREIAKQLSYYRGWARENVSESKVKRIMNFLKETGRITVKKEPAGVLITVLNYNLYQTPANYERTKLKAVSAPTSEPIPNQRQLTNNKKEKKEKTNNNYSIKPEIEQEILKFLSSFKKEKGYLWKMTQDAGADAVEKAWKRKGNSGVHSPSTLWNAAKEFRKYIDDRNRDALPDL